MTRLRWTELAQDDFLGIIAWIEREKPAAAARVGLRILGAAEDLAAHPYLGKRGRVLQTRELAVARLPYLIVYAVEAGNGTPEQPEVVAILRVLHGAMLWPQEDVGNT